MSTESFCFVNTVEEAYKLISDYETENTVKFACYKSNKNFVNTGKKCQTDIILMLIIHFNLY